MLSELRNYCCRILAYSITIKQVLQDTLCHLCSNANLDQVHETGPAVKKASRRPIIPGTSGGFDRTNVTTVSRWIQNAQGSLNRSKSRWWIPPGSDVEQDLGFFGIAPIQGKKPILRSLCPIMLLSTPQRQQRSNKDARNEDDAPYCSLIRERARAVRPLPHKPHRSRCTDIQPWRRFIINQCHVFLAALFQLLQGRRKNPVNAMTTFRLSSEKFPNDVI